MPEIKKKVIISSTALDLPAHRKEALDACLRQGMFPLMMEHLPASDADAIAESLRLVDEADIYVGIYAHRYGYVPKGHDISITEMEYDHATERGIPRLLFVIDKAHPITIEMVELGEGAAKLERFKARIGAERVANFFKSPEDLRSKIIDSLSNYREPNLTAFHYVRDIPPPPEPYIAHPYVLLQTSGLVGRQRELNLLTDWVAKPSAEVYRARILNVVAIGGMGKSALTWKWFNDIAPHELRPLAGRFWWSFYESDASFENFVIRALAYVSGRAREDIEKHTKPGEREDLLLQILDREPFLLVLDGLERILIAYARMDAARLQDDDYDVQTANYVAGALGLPASAAQSFVGQHQLRKTADPRAGNFLRKLANARGARILVSTRLYPAELQSVTGGAIPGSAALFLPGLTDDDTLDLWRAFGVSGSREALLPLFKSFDNYPLLIRALAGEVAQYRRAPGDFGRWRADHPDFNPFNLPLIQAKTHVLEFAMRGLDERARQVLHTVAAFRMPASYDTLAALLVGEGKPFADEKAFDTTLAELEDRGLLGWDKVANRYDLHPIVRGVTWNELADTTRQKIFAARRAYFEALPSIDDWRQVDSLDDLVPAIELYNTLIGLGRYDDAYIVLKDRLLNAMLHRLSITQQLVELLELMFPDGVDQAAPLSNEDKNSYVINALALAHVFSGRPSLASSLYYRWGNIAKQSGNDQSLSACLRNLTHSLSIVGSLRDSLSVGYNGLIICRQQSNEMIESETLSYLGLILAISGQEHSSEIALQRALQIDRNANIMIQGFDIGYLAQRALLFQQFVTANLLANQAWEIANSSPSEREFIRAARLQGASALGLSDLSSADERLHLALSRARAVSFVEEELPALTALAELRRRQGRPDEARALLDDVWELAERGPYPLFHADALNVLAQIERDAGNTEAAIRAATRAYELAWCDGPPYAYHWGLEAAKAHLQALGAPEPQLPPFDETKYEPMPEVEIDPPDEPAETE